MRQASGALITRQPTTHAAGQINEGPGWRRRELTQREAELGSGEGDGDRDEDGGLRGVSLAGDGGTGSKLG